MIRFILMVNKQGQTRLSQYYEYLEISERAALEGELIRKCLSRSENQCSFIQYRQYKVVYRRENRHIKPPSSKGSPYASLYFIVGLRDDPDVNELATLELIHCLVETLDKFFENVCELDIMFHLEKAHFIIYEMIVDGCVVETNKANIMAPIQMMEKAS